MKNVEHQLQEEEKTSGLWSRFLNFWLARYYSRTDPRAIIILAIAAIALMIFGGVEGLIFGSFLLWYLATILIPFLFRESLCRRFGLKWGTIISYAPLWLPFLIGFIAWIWM